MPGHSCAVTITQTALVNCDTQLEAEKLKKQEENQDWANSRPPSKMLPSSQVWPQRLLNVATTGHVASNI